MSASPHRELVRRLVPVDLRGLEELDLDQLVHQRVFGVKPSGAVDQQHVRVAGLRGGRGVEHDRRGVGSRALGDDLDPEAPSPGLQLLDGRRPKRVAGGQQDAPALGLVAGRQFRHRGRLPHPIDPDEQDDQRARTVRQRARRDSFTARRDQRLEAFPELGGIRVTGAPQVAEQAIGHPHTHVRPNERRL